jgi:hypothetical protein
LYVLLAYMQMLEDGKMLRGDENSYKRSGTG